MNVTRRQLAEVFGVSEETVANWQKDAAFPPFKRGMGRHGSSYDTAAVIRWYAGKGDDAKARLARLQGDKVELELARLRGDSLSATDVEVAVSALGAVVRSCALSVRGRCAPYATPEVLEVIDQAHREMLSEFSSDGFAERVRREAGEAVRSSDDTAAGADAEPVGGPVPPPKRRGKRRAGSVAD